MATSEFRRRIVPRARMRHVCIPQTIDRDVGGMLIYLDLNHWIDLEKAAVGHTSRRLWNFCLRLAQSGRAVFPVSWTTLMELQKIPSSRRSVICKIMMELSGLRIIISRSELMLHEVAALGSLQVDGQLLPTTEYAPVLAPKLQILQHDDIDVTKEYLEANPHKVSEFQEMENVAGRALFRMWAGSSLSVEGEAELRRMGFGEEMARSRQKDICQRRLEREHGTARVLRDNRDVDPLDLITARELIGEYIHGPFHSIEGMQLWTAITANLEKEALSTMPGLAVSSHMKTSLHGDRGRTWSRNDIYDLDMLSNTVPYCDYVFCDKEMSHHYGRGGLPQMFRCKVSSDLRDLSTLRRADDP